MPKQKRSFEVEIEAKLTVHAFDEASARKKVEKAFSSGRSLARTLTPATVSGPTRSSPLLTDTPDGGAVAGPSVGKLPPAEAAAAHYAQRQAASEAGVNQPSLH